MPVLLKKDHPMIPILQQEGYHVRERSPGGDVLRIGLLNLMPKKIETEGHFARVLSNSVVNVELVLLQMTSYTPKHASQQHMRTFYKPWTAVVQAHTQLDGLIITGAPVELFDFESVDYWKELLEVFDFVRSHKICTLFVCWAAQAALHAYFHIQKHRLPEKAFGIYQHRLTSQHPLFLGFDDNFLVPVSRHTAIQKEDVSKIDVIQVLSESNESGLYALYNTELPHFFLFNHLEYEAETLGNEYSRDLERGDFIVRPHNYFLDHAQGALLHRWRSYAMLLHSNWVHICVNEQEKRMKGMQRVRVGIIGHTDLARVVVKQFYRRRDNIETKTGTYIELVMSKEGASELPSDQLSYDQQGVMWVQTNDELIEDEDINVLVEAYGSEQSGLLLIEKAFQHQKSVIATDARILAEHGLSIIQKAEAHNVAFAYESIVGSGIPVLKTIREALASDRINHIHAALSAPSNILLTEVEKTGMSVAALRHRYEDASKIAPHDLEPSNEDRYVSGYDTAFKLNVLSCIGFGKNYLINEMPIYGISAIEAVDIKYAKRCECRIKLCGYARDEDEYITAWVGPMLLECTNNVPSHSLLGLVEDSQNALHCRSQAVGDLFLQGPGIGAEPAANAVLSDLVDILVSRTRSSFGVPAREIPTLSCQLPQQQWQWYARSSCALSRDTLAYLRQEYFEGYWCIFTEEMSAHQFLASCPSEVLFFAPLYKEENTPENDNDPTQ